MPSNPPSESPPPGLVALGTAVMGAWRARRTALRDAMAKAAPRLLTAERRAHLARVVYGTVRDERRLEFALAGTRGWDELPFDERDAALLLAFRVADRELSPREASDRYAAVSRAVRPTFEEVPALDEAIEQVDDELVRFGLRHSLADWLCRLLRAEFGAAAEAVAAALRGEPPRTIRANLLQVTSRGALAGDLAGEGVTTTLSRFSPWSLDVVDEAALFSLAAYEAGAFEQQDEGSQLVALVTAPPPRGRVLDACAGSGGKTLALAAMLGGKGAVLAADSHERRIEALQRRARRAGASNVRAVVVAEERWSDEVAAFASKADRILLDVPCSGLGSFRRRPEARWTLVPTDLESLRRIQRELLDRAARALRPGARVVYATCTMLAAENEDQVHAALQRHPQLELVRIAEILGGEKAKAISDASGTFLQVRPDTHGCDGFFAAVLRRKRG